MTESETLRVLLVDDQQLVRTGFALILSVESDLEVVGQAANGREAIELARQRRPDVVLMDVQMPEVDGIEATAAIVAEGTGKVIMLTTFDRDDYLFDALTAGASGFLLKNADPEHLVEAVRSVGHGHALLAPEVTRRVIERMVTTRTVPAPHPSLDTGTPPEATAATPPGSADRAAQVATLTDREREVLGLVARGMSNAEIARALFLGEATVKTHVSACLSKLHLRDRVQAVVMAYEQGLVRPGD